MIWTALRWVWRVESPLFIGLPPAGSLNRCLYYLPARAMHGAVTTELARLKGDEKSDFPDYGKFGHEIGLNCRFTYLYPARQKGDNFLVRLPEYKRKKGLQWCCRSGGTTLSDRDYRCRLLNSRPATAIAPATDSADDGTLRETECINPFWRESSNTRMQMHPMLFLGYIFLKNNGFRRQLDSVDKLFIGGDTRYGLGKICRVRWHNLSGDPLVFGQPVHLDGESPRIQSRIVWGHALQDEQPQLHGMQGLKTRFGGWEQDHPLKGALTWAPGSFIEHSAKRSAIWSIDKYGYWVHQWQL
jgi:hypothetical protein